MAQFGKHLFGTSLFGESNSFVGTYDTRVVDAGINFNGKITVSIENNRPSSFYLHNNKLFKYEGEANTKKDKTTLSKDSKVSTYVSGKNIKIMHGAGKATVTVTEESTQEVRNYTTNNTGVLELENFPEDKLTNYLITITAIEEFEFIQLEILTTEIQALVRATTEEMGRTDYFLKGDWPLALKDDSMKEHDKHWTYNYELKFKEEKDETLVAETISFENIRYIQIKLILLTTDEKTSPIVNEIQFYSGDLSKYRENGIWQTTLDMNNIAKDKNTTFKKVKKVEWVESEKEQSKIDLHSSSRNGETPSNINIRDDSFWSDLTSKYILKHDGVVAGVPYSRVALKEAGNGQTQTKRHGSLMIGPINTLNLGFTNTVIKSLDVFSGIYFYPRNSNQSSIQIEFFEKKDDDLKGILPIHTIVNPETYKEQLLDIRKNIDNVYIKISFDRDSGISTPVFDVFNLDASLSYKFSRSYTSQLSALDGHELNNSIGEGKSLVNIIDKDEFDWPPTSQKFKVNKENILNSNKNLKIRFSPKYINQVYVGIEEAGSSELNFKDEYPYEYKIYSQVYAEEPKASVNEVSKDKLYWHYSYDGGTVNFPIETKRPLSTQFTPLLLKNKKYKYKVVNGWSDPKFKVPYTMTLGEIANITLTKESEILKVNKNLPLYQGKVLVGYEVVLPNKSVNELINLRFKKSKNIVTDYSVLNEKENDFIRAWINESDNYKYKEWTSEEVMFEGLINLNDKKSNYSRKQNSAYNVIQKGNHIVSIEKETAIEIAARYDVNLEDLLMLNNKKEIFKRNDIVVIPGSYSLPDIKSGLVFEGNHPYKVEIIPGTVRKNKNNVRLANNVLIPGSDDEEAIKYSLTESSTETIYIKRGNIENGRDRIPVANVIEIHSIKSQDGNTNYIESTGNMGDFILSENHIDWSPVFKHSKEPKSGDFYAVVITRGVVDNLKITYSSNYTEKMSQDRMEAIPIIENKEYQMDLIKDQIVYLNPLKDMKEKYPTLKNLRYVAQNSDLWVNTEVNENEVRVSMNGENPNINWYPTVNTGFYYLNNKEHYLYSRPIKTIFNDKDIPSIKNVEYTEKGLRAPKK